MTVCQCVFFPHVGLKERLVGELLEPGAGQVWLLDCGQGVSTQLTVGTNLATQTLRQDWSVGNNCGDGDSTGLGAGSGAHSLAGEAGLLHSAGATCSQAFIFSLAQTTAPPPGLSQQYLAAVKPSGFARVFGHVLNQAVSVYITLAKPFISSPAGRCTGSNLKWVQ